MKKIFLIIISVFIFSLSQGAYSAFYGIHRESIGAGPVTWCPEDGDYDGGKITFGPGNGFSNYTYDSMVQTISGNLMACAYWDNAIPTATNNYGFSGVWKNFASATITLSPSDTGGSGVNTTKWCEGASCDPSTGTVGTSITKNAPYNNTIRYQTWDNAGNASVIGSVTVKLDNTPPAEGDISITPSGTNFLANDNQNFSISVSDNGWAPINSIIARFEDFNTTNSLLFGNFNSSLSPLNINVSTQKVDNDRQVNGSRIYTLRITEICDEAGNCTNSFADRNYNVYANSINLGVKNVTTNELENISNIADGTQKNLTITLIDTYGNIIIPATGISRTIDFNFNTNNNLYLNQYTRTGNSVFMNIPNDSSTFSNRFNIGNSITTSFNSQPSLNGIYNFGFKVYTPTQNIDDKAYGNFIINSITTDINGNIGLNPGESITSSSNINFKFNPLYRTSFSGDLKNFGFIEGAIQNSSITISKNTPSLNGTYKELYLEYGSGARQIVSNLEMKYNESGIPLNVMGEGNGNFSNFIPSEFNLTNYILRTKLTQLGGSILGLDKTYLSSHIKYSIDGKDVIYNSDIIGKSNYWDASSLNNTYQAGLKVLGIGSSKNASEIVINQFPNDVKILGSISKASLKKDILKNVYSMIKSVTPNNGILKVDVSDFSRFGGVKLKDNNIVYFNLTGGNVVVSGNVGNNQKKTIVVIGGNVYVNGNIRYSTDSMLGIIVLKDVNGNGGNLYIDPDVTRIDATIFTEKSIISYNGNILDGDTDVSILKNQLYIFGTVFSENTIGGSRMIPLKCPYYISSLSCTIVNAQTYDLNYLRRYFIYDSSGPSGIPDGTVDNYDIIPANGGTNYVGSFNTSTYQYARYPVVIEYNSAIAINPPPLFTK